MSKGSKGKREERIAALVSACSDRLNAGEAIDLAALLERHRDLQPELARALEILGDLSPPGRPAPAGLPRRFGDYALGRRVGRGGMGIVHEAVHEPTGRRVALKILAGALLGDDSSVSRFRREARITAFLDDPGIAAVYDAGMVDGVPFIAMRYEEGETLGEEIRRLRRCGKRDEGVTPDPWRHPVGRAEADRFARIIETVARTLQRAHEAGLVHRDVKPDNIMIRPGGDPVLLDFGLARAPSLELSTLTSAGSLLGTPAYMAPEQLRGDVRGADPRTDLYSLGACLYEVLTVERPFAAATREAIYRKILSEEPRPPSSRNPRLAKAFDAVVATCLAKEPERRYASGRELAEDLSRARRGFPVRARREGAMRRGWTWARRNPRLALASGGSLLVLVVGLTIALFLLARLARETRGKELALERVRSQANELSRLLDENRAALAKQEALRLASRSAVLLSQKPDLALLLALEAVERSRDGATLGPLLDALAETSETGVVENGAGVSAIAFNPRGGELTTAGTDGVIRLWESDSGRLLRLLVGHDAPLADLAYDAAGKRLASGSTDGVIHVWDASTGALLESVRESGQLVALRLAEGGQRLVSATRDGVFVRQLPEGRIVRRFAEPGCISLDLDHDGRVLSGGINVAHLWDLNRPEPSGVFSAPDSGPLRVALGPRGRLAAGADLHGRVHLWSIGSGERVGEFEAHRAAILALRFSPPGDSIATGAADGTAALWRVRDGENRARLRGHDGFVVALAFEPSGSRLATGSPDGTARQWDPRRSAAVPRIDLEAGSVVAAAFVEGGDEVLLATSRRLVASWRAGSREPIHRLRLAAPSRVGPHDDPVRRGALGGGSFDPEARRFAGWTRSGEHSLWSLDSGKWLGPDERFGPVRRRSVRLPGPKGESWAVELPGGMLAVGTGGEETWRRTPPLDSPLVLAFSPDGRRLAVGGPSENVLLLDARSGAEELVLPGPHGGVLVLAFDSKGNRLAAGCRDHTVRVWDTRQSAEPFVLRGHSGAVGTVRFDPSGARLLSGSEDGTARLWPLDPVRVARGALARGPTPEEVSRYGLGDVGAAREGARLGRRERLRREIEAALGSLPTGSFDRYVHRFLLDRLRLHLASSHERAEVLESAALAREVAEATGRRRPELLGVLADARAAAGDGAGATAILEEAVALPGARRPLARRLERLRRARARGEAPAEAREGTGTPRRQEEGGSAVVAAAAPSAGAAALPSAGAGTAEVLDALAREGAVRIDCGGDGYRDRSGHRWSADRFYLSGYRYWGDELGGAIGPFTGEIAGTEDDSLYRTERWFVADACHDAGYAIPLPPGRYRVGLHFAEIFCTGRGERVFDVLLEDRAVLIAFDPAARGVLRAEVRSFDIDVRDGVLDLRLRAARNAPKISAIEIRPLASSAASHPSAPRRESPPARGERESR